MEDAAEFTGRTVEDAIAVAERALDLGRDEMNIEVLTQGSRGVFGIGAESARIRARPKRPEAPPQQSAAPAVARAADTVAAETVPQTSTAVAPARDTAGLPGEAQEVLQQLLRTMGFNAEVSVRSTEDPVMLVVTGDNLGVLIGRRGDNLAALQFMVNLILSKNRRSWPKIVIDVENYRARREESLRTLADRIAYRVRRNQKPFTLEAMPASDRRIIHLALRDRPDVETYSIGEGPSRRVVIAPTQRAHSNNYRDQE